MTELRLANTSPQVNDNDYAYFPRPNSPNVAKTSWHCGRAIQIKPSGYAYCCRAKARIDGKASGRSRRAPIWDRDMFISYLYEIVGMSLRLIFRMFGEGMKLKSHTSISRAFKRMKAEFLYRWNKAEKERNNDLVREQPHAQPLSRIGKVYVDKVRFHWDWKSKINEALNVHIGIPQPYRCQDCGKGWFEGARVCPYCGWGIGNMFCNFWRQCRWGGERGKAIWQERMG